LYCFYNNAARYLARPVALIASQTQFNDKQAGLNFQPVFYIHMIARREPSSRRKRKDPLLTDNIFISLVDRLYKNYEIAKSQIHEVEEGVENKDIIGVLLVNCEHGAQLCNRKPKFREYNSLDDIMESVINERKDDGGYVMQVTEDGKYHLSNKNLFAPEPPLMQKFGLRKLWDIEPFLLKYLPEDFTHCDEHEINIGAKTTAGLSAALVGGVGKTYFLKQTAYDGTGTGKLVVFGEKGTECELFLLKTDEPGINPEYVVDIDHKTGEKVVNVMVTYKFDEKLNDLVEMEEVYLKPEEVGQKNYQDSLNFIRINHPAA